MKPVAAPGGGGRHRLGQGHRIHAARRRVIEAREAHLDELAGAEGAVVHEEPAGGIDEALGLVADEAAQAEGETALGHQDMRGLSHLLEIRRCDARAGIAEIGAGHDVAAQRVRLGLGR
jgi:hypothetical protein